MLQITNYPFCTKYAGEGRPKATYVVDATVGGRKFEYLLKYRYVHGEQDRLPLLKSLRFEGVRPPLIDLARVHS